GDGQGSGEGDEQHLFASSSNEVVNSILLGRGVLERDVLQLSEDVCPHHILYEADGDHHEKSDVGSHVVYWVKDKRHRHSPHCVDGIVEPGDDSVAEEHREVEAAV